MQSVSLTYAARTLDELCSRRKIQKMWDIYMEFEGSFPDRMEKMRWFTFAAGEAGCTLGEVDAFLEVIRYGVDVATYFPQRFETNEQIKLTQLSIWGPIVVVIGGLIMLLILQWVM